MPPSKGSPSRFGRPATASIARSGAQVADEAPSSSRRSRRTARSPPAWTAGRTSCAAVGARGLAGMAGRDSACDLRRERVQRLDGARAASRRGARAKYGAKTSGAATGTSAAPAARARTRPRRTRPSRRPRPPSTAPRARRTRASRASSRASRSPARPCARDHVGAEHVVEVRVRDEDEVGLAHVGGAHADAPARPRCGRRRCRNTACASRRARGRSCSRAIRSASSRHSRRSRDQPLAGRVVEHVLRDDRRDRLAEHLDLDPRPTSSAGRHRRERDVAPERERVGAAAHATHDLAAGAHRLAAVEAQVAGSVADEQRAQAVARRRALRERRAPMKSPFAARDAEADAALVAACRPRSGRCRSSGSPSRSAATRARGSRRRGCPCAAPAAAQPVPDLHGPLGRDVELVAELADEGDPLRQHAARRRSRSSRARR